MVETVDAPMLASWWTPTGWERHPVPAAFLVAQKRMELPTGWPEDLLRAGYGNDFGTNRESDADATYQVTVWSHRGGPDPKRHLFVEIWDFWGSPAEMFVAEENIAPFFFDKLPELIRFQREINSPVMAKAFVAFVRHGHGKRTISEDGTETLEEAETRRELERLDRQMRDAEAKAGKPA